MLQLQDAKFSPQQGKSSVFRELEAAVPQAWLRFLSDHDEGDDNNGLYGRAELNAFLIGLHRVNPSLSVVIFLPVLPNEMMCSAASSN